MANKKTDPIDFELALKELTTIVEQLEQGGVPLEESLKQFERGISLARSCQQTLKEAEQKVQILMQQGGEAKLEPYKGDDPA